MYKYVAFLFDTFLNIEWFIKRTLLFGMDCQKDATMPIGAWHFETYNYSYKTDCYTGTLERTVKQCNITTISNMFKSAFCGYRCKWYDLKK